jgi:2-amino-4-hydroxy-6-hydroxymethyldihydropteridine diphosphokinase
VNIVLSRSLQRDDVMVCRSVEELWQLLGQIQLEQPQKKMLCIGGGEIYRLLLPYAKELLLTEVAGEFAADTFFPSLTEFLKASREERCGLAFVRYVRAGADCFSPRR